MQPKSETYTIMSKKILILNGSPRLMGNTMQMVAQFKKGAEEAGHVVTVLMNVGDIEGHPKLEDCYQLGKNI